MFSSRRLIPIAAFAVSSLAACREAPPPPTNTAAVTPTAASASAPLPPSSSPPPASSATPDAAAPPRPPHWVNGVVWSPSGRRAATWCTENCPPPPAGETREEGKCPIYLWDLGHGHLLDHFDVPCGHGQVHVEWSYDDRLVASSDYDSLWIRRVDDRKLITETGAIAMYGGFEFSPDGKRLIWGNVFGSVNVLDSETGRVLRAAQLHPGAASLGWFARWDPTGRLTAVGLEHGGLELWDGRSGALLRAINVPGFSGDIDTQWTRDGKRLAIVAGDGLVALTDLGTGKTTILQRAVRVEGIGGPVPTIGDLSPDETKLAVFDGFGRLTVWDLQKGTRRELLPPAKDMNWGLDLRWAPGGQEIFIDGAGGRPRLVSVDEPARVRPVDDAIHTDQEHGRLLGWAPDGARYWKRGRTLFAFAADGTPLLERDLGDDHAEVVMRKDSRFLAIAAGELELLRLRDRASLRFVVREKIGELRGMVEPPLDGVEMAAFFGGNKR